MEMIVLAGGLGTRLKSVVSDLPKPMAPVNGRPFLEYVLRWIGKQGVTHVVLAVSYQWEKIHGHFGCNFEGIELSYSVEKEPLGTGGGIRLALENTKEPDVFACNGDTLFRVCLNDMMNLHLTDGYDLTLAAREVRNVSRYGSIRLAGAKIVDFEEKTNDSTGIINGGVYLFSREWFLSQKKESCFSFEKDVIMSCKNAGAHVSDAYFIDIGIPEDFERAQKQLLRPALFLDRDGVINEDIHHLHRIEDCKFRPGIFDIVKGYYDKGYAIVIITNQAGIAKRLYTENDYFKLRDWMHAQFAARGISITAEYYCPHHPDHTGRCTCRKPAPGMVLQAAREHNIDLPVSVLIGDKESDIEAGRKAGIGECLIVGDIIH